MRARALLCFVCCIALAASAQEREVALDRGEASGPGLEVAGFRLSGFFVGSATGGKPGLQSALGLDDGGPPQITDIVINLTWTGSGVQWSNRYSGNNKCLDYIATFQSAFDYEFSTATGTIGDDTASDPLAQVAHSTQTSNANITVPAACNPYGF